MNAMRKSATLPLVACLMILIPVGNAQEQPPGQSKAAELKSELVEKLTKKLNITPEQAKGGAGAIFGVLKNRLKPEDFNRLAAVVPQMDELLKAAPPAREGSLLAALGSVSSGGTADLASLAGSFDSLGLSPAMVARFVPVIQKYLKSKGGSGLATIFSGAMK